MTASLRPDVDSDKAKPFDAVFATAGVSTPNRGMFLNRIVPGRAKSVRSDQLASVPIFDLSPSLLKLLIVSSTSLSEKVQSNGTWADSHQLSTTWDGLVLRGNSQIVVPLDEDLRKAIIGEYHDNRYAGHYGIENTQQAVGRLFWWSALTKDVTTVLFNSSPQTSSSSLSKDELQTSSDP